MLMRHRGVFVVIFLILLSIAISKKVNSRPNRPSSSSSNARQPSRSNSGRTSSPRLQHRTTTPRHKTTKHYIITTTPPRRTTSRTTKRPKTYPITTTPSSFHTTLPHHRQSTPPKTGWQIPPPKNHSTVGSSSNTDWTKPKQNTSKLGWEIPPSKNHSTVGGSNSNTDWTKPKQNTTQLGWQIPPPKNHSTVGSSSNTDWTKPKQNTTHVGWQIPPSKNHSMIGTPNNPPSQNHNSSGNHYGWTTPPKQNVSTIGWQIPTNPTKNHGTNSSQNNGWTTPPKQNVSTIGWQVPAPKNHTTVGSHNRTWTTPSKNNTSNLGWRIPPPSNHSQLGSQNTGWPAPKQNSSNIGWVSPGKNHSTTQNTGRPSMKQNSTNVGLAVPSQKNYTNNGNPKNTSFTKPFIHNTLPPHQDNGWTTPKTNVWQQLQHTNQSNMNNRQNNSWTNKRNVSNVGWNPSYQDNWSLQHQNNGWTTLAPNFHFVTTPRPFVSVTYPNQQSSYGVGPVYHQPVYPNYHTPAASPIIINNNHHTSSYGHVQPPVTIINNNVNNHIHYPTYSYSTNDYGRSDLGFYLGYRLGQLTKPSYYYSTSTYYNGHEHVPLYDHYEIHHYYHNSDNVKKEAKVEPNQIISCPGDSYAFCPPNTTALCLNTGSVMCVVKSEYTAPCATDKNLNCLTSTIPCVENTKMSCTEQNQNQSSLSIPCISTLQLQGTLSINNNNLIVNNSSQYLNSLCVTVAAVPAQNKKDKKKWEEYRTRKTYHYITHDTGTSSLGFLLGQSLEELLDPGFKYLNYHQNGSYVEKYDHYYIYHFYANRDLIPATIDVFPNSTAACYGDSGTFCPNETISLCLSDGSIACLVNSKNVKNCTVSDKGCVQQRIACNESKIPECRNSTNITVTIPCFSLVKLHGNVSTINSTFITKNITKHYSTLKVSPNISTIESYYLTALAAPAEKSPGNTIDKEAKQLHNSSEVHYNLPNYTYDKKNFSKNSMGYYLIDHLQKLTLPSYYYLNLASSTEVIQKYDHYDMHYYGYNNKTIPGEMYIRPNEIISCAGDSGSLCPPNTTALCLNSGTVMCVTDALVTDPCQNTSKGAKFCAKLTLPCKTVFPPNCLTKRASRHVLLPCMSFAKIFGNVIYVENKLNVLSEDGKKSKEHIYTDLEVLDLENSSKTQIFCVPIVFTPIERQLSDGERVLRNIKNIFSRFVMAAIV